MALDGWRGISILLVLAGHLFPLGPKYLNMNGCIATLGMAIFFTLSGFLITTTLLYRPSVVEFLVRRLCRIVPLAWLFTLIALTLAKVSFHYYVAQMLFFSNLPPYWLTDYTGHLWSLCVEMQFYIDIPRLRSSRALEYPRPLPAGDSAPNTRARACVHRNIGSAR